MTVVRFMGGEAVPISEVEYYGADPFYGMSEDEIAYVLDNNPELMGKGKVKAWFKRRKEKAKKVFQKLKKRKAGKKAGATALALLNPFAAAAAARRKRKKKLSKMTPEQRAAAQSKSKKRRKVAAGLSNFLVPGAGAFGKLGSKIRQRRQKRKMKKAMANRPKSTSTVRGRVAAGVSARRRLPGEAPSRTGQSPGATIFGKRQGTMVVPGPVAEAIENGEATTAAVQTSADEDGGQEAAPEQQATQKAGLGKALPIAALAALPFLLGK